MQICGMASALQLACDNGDLLDFEFHHPTFTDTRIIDLAY